MAKTSGHGNAHWSRDETILALDLLNEFDGQVPDKGHVKVIELSEYLRSLPTHPPEKRKGSFRNPAGVAFKLQNLRAVATGKGLTNVSHVDQEVWSSLGGNPAEVRKLANEIRANAKVLGELPDEEDEEGDEEFAEGATATKLHKRRERNRGLRKKLIAKCIQTNQLYCRACGDQGPLFGTDYNHSMFEAHHVKPLSGGPTKTTIADLALLCANCHRLIHRVMVVQKKWIGIEAFKQFLNESRSGVRRAA